MKHTPNGVCESDRIEMSNCNKLHVDLMNWSFRAMFKCGDSNCVNKRFLYHTMTLQKRYLNLSKVKPGEFNL